jgi:ubiquinone/menaquinone biosynthesis C-methylase UbiE
MRDYYDDHPISEAAVLDGVRERRTVPGTALSADDLFDFDQDHYGGLAAVQALARRIGARPGTRVIDIGAGLGGPARFLATQHACRVVAVELHGGRAMSALRLNRRAGLADAVRVVRADARRLPFRGRSFDAGISQETLLHIDDKASVLAECHRVLVPGGRLAFSDWVAARRLDDGERRRLHDWMAATTLQTTDGYRLLLGRAGFRDIEVEDLSVEWRAVVRERLARLRGERQRMAVRIGADRVEAHVTLHAFFLRLLEDGKVGGARLHATR